MNEGGGHSGRRGAGGLMTLITGVGVLLAAIAMIVLAVRSDEGVATGADTLKTGQLIVGLQDERLPVVPITEIAPRLSRLKVSGVRFTRLDVSWAQISPTKPAKPSDPDDPAYQWGRTDAILDGLRDRGIDVVVSFSQTPGWSNGNKTSEWFGGIDDYGAFVHAFAARYNGDRHAMVQIYEPWSEPNNAAMLMPQWEGAGATAKPVSPAAYRDIYERARKEIAAASPDAAVAGLGLADIETSTGGIGGIGVRDFIAALLPDAPPMSLVSQHLTPIDPQDAGPTRVPSIAAMATYIELVDRVAPGADVLITAVGYPTPEGGMSEDEQARELTRTFDSLARFEPIRLAVWYSMQDTIERPSGLVRLDGTEKPSWKAFLDVPKLLPSGGTP